MSPNATAVRVTTRSVRRFDIGTGRPFAVFRAAYEAAVPAFDRLEAISVVLSNSGWDAIQRLSDATAPNGLVNFFTFDPSPVRPMHGHNGHGVTYLAGNIVKAEPGFGIDPSCFLYVPMQVAIVEAPGGTARLSFDHPGDLFDGLGNLELRPVAEVFTAAWAQVLEVLELPVPADLAATPQLPEQDLIGVGKRFLAALGGQDWDTLRDLVTPGATWTFPGDAAISGTARGIEAILVKAAAIASSGVHIDVEHVLAGISGTCVVLHNTAHADDGRQLDQYLVSTLNVIGGRVDRIETFLSEPSKITAYFGPIANSSPGHEAAIS
jgi:ketosteroid isomerase-like protein